MDALERARNSGRPFDVAMLDEGLADARDRVETYSGAIRDFERQHAAIFEERKRLGQALHDAEYDRRDAEEGIKRRGFTVYTREAWARMYPAEDAAGDVSGTP